LKAQSAESSAQLDSGTAAHVTVSCISVAVTISASISCMLQNDEEGERTEVLDKKLLE
jgi:hypothetical protein